MLKIFQLLAVGMVLFRWSAATVSAEVLIPGIASSKLDPELKGLVLIEELNCTVCHAGNEVLAARSKKAPRLAAVGARVAPNYIEAFIRDPHGAKPGTTMPDMLARLGDAEKKETARALTHFLLSQQKNDFSPQAPDPVAGKLGEKLFHSRGCAACHSPRDAQGVETMPATSVPLGALEKKYSHRSLVDFLQRPHAVRPSGRMPDMRLDAQETERIAHYLLRETRVPGHLAFTLYRGQVWEGLESDEVHAERGGQVEDFAPARLGKILQHSAVRYEGWLKIAHPGEHKFFLEMNGGSLRVDGKSVAEQKPSDRRGTVKFDGTAKLDAGWRKIELVYFHTGREPKFSFEMEGPQFPRQPIPSALLSVSDKPVAEFKPLQVDAALAARGREHFAQLGCARCHDDLKVMSAPAPALAKLDPTRGCLTSEKGKWPRFDLSTEQRALIVKSLPRAEHPLNDQQMLDKTLVTFNCIGCHERAGLGGIPPERNAIFTGTKEALGDQGRLPPPLTHVGAKLTPKWITEVLLNGKRQRDYVDAAMPQFGEANVGHLVELFGKLDKLEEVAFPKVANIRESKDAGYEMIGTNGFSCIACHDFNGQKSGGAGALDIVHATERLKKNWFYLYMRQPSRFHPTVIMPSYWPGGQSIRPAILGGDTAQQIEALWAYLEDGTRAKKPAGLSRQSSEIRVADVAEVVRGRGTAGFRWIGVGYPGRINLAFDSEEMALRMLWSGEFADADIGTFRPRGTVRISFPPGIPFHRLKSRDDHWPYKGKTNYTFPQDHGYQFRGYTLDALRRPTFMYRYGEIGVEDFFEDLLAPDGKRFFRRTLSFDAPSAQQPFYFRVAVGKKVVVRSPQVVDVDSSLRLRITTGQRAEVREGDPAEVLIPLTLPKGGMTLVLEYGW